MNAFLALLLLLMLLLIVAGLVGLTIGIRRSQERSNQIVPGVPSPAPASWAGAHTPEARLHRRLRDAVSGLRAQADVGVSEAERHDLEQAALDIDAQLVAIAALPERLRADHLATAEAAVTALEDAAGTLLAEAVKRGGSAAGGRLEEVAERLRLLEAARAELDRAVPPPGGAAPGGSASHHHHGHGDELDPSQARSIGEPGPETRPSPPDLAQGRSAGEPGPQTGSDPQTDPGNHPDERPDPGV